jgi:hypothetical protein
MKNLFRRTSPFFALISDILETIYFSLGYILFYFWLLVSVGLREEYGISLNPVGYFMKLESNDFIESVEIMSPWYNY